MKAQLQERVAHNLSALRQNAQLSQSALAAKISVCRSTYCQYEHGDRLPDVATLYTLCEFYHVNMDTMLRYDVREVLQEYFLFQEYTQDTTKLLMIYNSLSEFSKGRLLERAEELAQLDQMKKRDAFYLNY